MTTENLGIDFPTDRQIDLEAAWGIYRMFLRLGVPYRATIELKVFDDENYLIPVVRADGKIYHTRFLAHRASPKYSQMTAYEVKDFVQGVAEVISTSKDKPHVGYVEFLLFSVDDAELNHPTQIIRWKASKGVLSITDEAPPKYRQQ